MSDRILAYRGTPGEEIPFGAKADRRNHMTSEQRSDAGRKGRGEDAFAKKESRQWAKIEARIQGIVEREHGLRMAGSGYDVIHDQRHMTHRTLKAIKF